MRAKLTQINDELHDLEDRDILLPPDPNPASVLEVIPVHHDMDREVQRDGDPGNSGRADELRIAEQRRRAMVVRVQEGKGLLLEHEESGVDELDVFDEIVQLR